MNSTRVFCKSAPKSAPVSESVNLLDLFQEIILRRNNANQLSDSLYGFRTYEGTSWLLDYDVMHTPVDPDTIAVNRINQNNQQRSVSSNLCLVHCAVVQLYTMFQVNQMNRMNKNHSMFSIHLQYFANFKSFIETAIDDI